MAERGPSPVAAPGQGRVAVAQAVRAAGRDMAAAPAAAPAADLGVDLGADLGAADGHLAEACSGRLTLPGRNATSA